MGRKQISKIVLRPIFVLICCLFGVFIEHIHICILLESCGHVSMLATTGNTLAKSQILGGVRASVPRSTIGSASGSRDFTRFGPGGSTLSRFPCKTPIGKVGTSQYKVVTRKLA